jgi:hypothetical protein
MPWSINKGFHTRYEAFTALKAKLFLVGILAKDELFKRLGPNKSVENHTLFVDGIIPRFGYFDAFSDPVTLFFKGNMHILNAHNAT